MNGMEHDPVSTQDSSDSQEPRPAFHHLGQVAKKAWNNKDLLLTEDERWEYVVTCVLLEFDGNLSEKNRVTAESPRKGGNRLGLLILATSLFLLLLALLHIAAK